MKSLIFIFVESSIFIEVKSIKKINKKGGLKINEIIYSSSNWTANRFS